MRKGGVGGKPDEALQNYVEKIESELQALMGADIQEEKKANQHPP